MPIRTDATDQAGKIVRSDGNVTITVVPLPTSLSICSMPPCASVSDLVR